MKGERGKRRRKGRGKGTGEERRNKLPTLT